MHESYIKDGKLIPKSDWENRILGLKAASKEDLKDRQRAMQALSEEIIRAVSGRVPEGEPFGVLFSGGVDSSLIALLLKKAGRDFICYTVGFKAEDTAQPEDVSAALAAADGLSIILKTKVMDLEEAERLINRTVKMLGPGLNNVVNVGVGGVVLGCIEMAEKDGIRYLFSGLGSEEIFAGYDRHRKARPEDRQEECWRGLAAMYERDLLRDSAISKATNMTILTPFLDEGLIRVAMRMPAMLKMDDNHSKLILREAAEGLGLAKAIAWRQKRAAQYGSRLDRAISKLAREKGFKLKKDYLKSLG